MYLFTYQLIIYYISEDFKKQRIVRALKEYKKRKPCNNFFLKIELRSSRSLLLVLLSILQDQ